MKVDWKEAGEMLLNGASFAEIADRFGVTRQCIHLYYTQHKNKGYRNSTSFRKVVFQGIADYMQEHHLSIKRFAMTVFKDPTESQIHSLYLFVIGKSTQVPLATIDAILRCIGKPFEEAFAPVQRTKTERQDE